jgi:hypothetical protein
LAAGAILALVIVRAVAAVAAVAGLAVPQATAYDTPPELSRVATVFALREVEIRCPSETEWSRDVETIGVWSYAHIRGGYAVLKRGLCDGALAVADARFPAWQRAAGVLALVHESFHLRPWRHRRNEGKVSCQAINNFEVGARLLGAPPEQVNELLPYALALHWRTIRLFPLYHDRACRLPIWRPPD